MAIISASLLAADLSRIGEEAKSAQSSGADWLHIDIMDGRFVESISFGPKMVKTLRNTVDLPLDVHLMVMEPERLIKECVASGANYITAHYEACPHLHRTVQLIHECGCKAGVALNPHTPVEMVKYILNELDMLLLMSVNPGFGGQRFLPLTYAKIQCFGEMCASTNRPLLQVDGGIGPHNAQHLTDVGVDVLVAGSAIFNSSDYKKAITALH